MRCAPLRTRICLFWCTNRPKSLSRTRNQPSWCTARAVTPGLTGYPLSEEVRETMQRPRSLGCGAGACACGCASFTSGQTPRPFKEPTPQRQSKWQGLSHARGAKIGTYLFGSRVPGLRPWKEDSMRRDGAPRGPRPFIFPSAPKWATGNPCMNPLMELVQGLFRSRRISYIPAVVPVTNRFCQLYRSRRPWPRDVRRENGPKRS